MSDLVKFDYILDDLRVDDTNFSFDEVDIPITVKDNQQLIVHDYLDIDSDLILNGRLVLEL